MKIKEKSGTSYLQNKYNRTHTDSDRWGFSFWYFYACFIIMKPYVILKHKARKQT